MENFFCLHTMILGIAVFEGQSNIPATIKGAGGIIF